jgi:hypothetical protein
MNKELLPKPFLTNTMVTAQRCPKNTTDAPIDKKLLPTQKEIKKFPTLQEPKELTQLDHCIAVHCE